eukprot:3706027-Alexandrium_andersonii.AAC.1
MAGTEPEPQRTKRVRHSAGPSNAPSTVKDPGRVPPVSGTHAQSAMELNKRCSELRETPQPGSRKE